MNRLRLSATLIERSILRYTPAGVPVAEAGLKHESAVIEAGVERKLDFECEAIALGAVAERLVREPLGSPIEIDGFLAPTRRGSQRLRIHLTEYVTKQISGEHHGNG